MSLRYIRTPGLDVTFLNEPYEVVEEDGTLQICFNVTRNNYLGFLNYTFIGLSGIHLLHIGDNLLFPTCQFIYYSYICSLFHFSVS